MDGVAHGPASIAALRDAVQKGREPPAADSVARLPSYWLFVIGTVCIGAFMGQVDSSIAQLLLPKLELEFNARLSTVSWVAVSYLLAMAAFLPIFGRLADMMGRKLLYTGGFLLFVLSSALCGLAPSLPVLIAFRVLQGIGAALLSSNSVAIVVAAAGPARRGRALGILSAAQAVGLSTGPALGGLVLDLLDWRWVFWINVPVGLAGTVLGWFLLPPTKDLPDEGRFDWKGALLIAPALTAVVAMLNEGYAWGVTSPTLIGCAVLALILLTLFVRCERRAEAPLIDFALFRRSAFLTGNVAGLLSYAALFGLFFLMPFMFVRVYQDSIFSAGAAALDRSSDAGPGGAGRRRALRPARRPPAHGVGHADLRARPGLAVRRHGWNAGKPRSRDAGAGHFRRRTGVVHLAQQQRDHGCRAGAA